MRHLAEKGESSLCDQVIPNLLQIQMPSRNKDKMKYEVAKITGLGRVTIETRNYWGFE